MPQSLEDLLAKYDEDEAIDYDLADKGINSIKDLPNQGVFPERIEQCLSGWKEARARPQGARFEKAKCS